jgi:hypothetical protein
MQKLLICIGLIILTAACSQTPGIERLKADTQLLPDEQQEFITSIIRYMGRLAPKATHETRFDEEFDDHYQKLVREYRLDYLYNDENSSTTYFLASITAPSLYGKRTATAGKVRMGENGSIKYYEESFRTWKLMPEDLEPKSAYLFSKLITGHDLSPYYPENSGDEEYIEFPNMHTLFDAEQRQWVTTLFDPSGDFRNTRYGNKGN